MRKSWRSLSGESENVGKSGQGRSNGTTAAPTPFVQRALIARASTVTVQIGENEGITQTYTI